MRSVTTERFRRSYAYLPENVQNQTRKAYKLWKKNPNHPSLQFKPIHDTEPVYSVRVSLSYRALGLKQAGVFIWFWIGSHADYDKMIASL